MNKLTWPEKLEAGDNVALIAPSSPADSSVLEKSVKSLEFLGLNPIVYPSCESRRGYLAGSDACRANDINEAFADRNLKGIFCMRGGYGATRILNLLDYHTISNNPKLFCGYSDITALHAVFNEKCRFVTFHSPMPNTGYHFMDAFSLNSLKSAVFMQECVISNPAGYELDTISPGIATGTLTGGNLSVILSTLGSPFQPDMKGKILFIEEVDEPTYKIDRMLTALSLAGVFDKCSGVILGYFSGCETYASAENLTLNEIFSDIFKKHKIPVLSGLCAGHSYPQLTLPFGASIKMNATLKTIELI